jgi:Ca-activated chloride channel family protein
MGNLKDGKLEKLADKGNGQYGYIDNQKEARKVFVEDLAGTLVTIAKDVKLQVEFNPAQVGAYRLLGYENRVMAAQDFNNDAKDAGDIGAGHTVTALYETMPAGEAPKPFVGDTLRYRSVVVPKEGGLAKELLTVKLRYKLPEADTSTLVEVPITDPKAPVSGVGGQPNPPSPPRMTRDFNWAAAVAAFGMILRDSQFRGQANFDMVLELAQGSLGEDQGGHRKEFIELVKSAKALYRGVAPAADGPATTPAATPLTREQAEAKAGSNGKYVNLLRIVEAPADAATYGTFRDFGRWEGTSYAGQDNLPKGYWVYVAPNWYIWGDEAQRQP